MKRNSTRLENGITVISEHAPNVHRAAVSVSIMAGSIHEPKEQAGLAHVLEHIVFRGTQKITAEDASAIIEDLGGHINGQTMSDHTMYYGSVIREDLGRTIAFLADLITEPAFEAEHLELEKNIVEDENCRGCYGCTMQETYLDSAYPDQVLARPIIGYEETVMSLTVESLKEFHEKFYVTENVVVAVCADITHDEVVDLVKKAFANMPKGQPSTWPILEYAGGDSMLNTRSDDAGVWLGFDVTEMAEKEKRALWLFSDIIGGHGHSILMDELREKRGLVYGVSTDIATLARRDHFRVYLNGSAANITEICNVAIDTIRDVAQNLPATQLAKAKRRQHVNEIMSRDGLEGRVSDMITDMSDLGYITNIEERFHNYQNLTASEIEAAAQNMLDLTPTIVISASLRRAPKIADLRERISGVRTGNSLLGFFKRAS